MFYLLVLLGLVLGSSAQCPVDSPCSCKEDESGNVIVCSRKGITTIPIFKPTSDSFSKLDLAGNAIGSVDRHAFYTTDDVPLNVKNINLIDNSISTVDDEAFTGMTSVKELSLGMSSAGEFPSAVSELPQLEELYVEGLVMEQLPSQALYSLTNLRVLSLTQCELRHIEDDDLYGQRNNLEELNLGNNKLQEVPSAAVDILTKLTKLNLQLNDITGLTEDAFYRMSKLQILDLSRNSLRSVAYNAFRGLEDTLHTLHLQFCRLHDVNLPPLARLRNLRNLKLDNNDNISRLPNHFFQNMGELEELRLRSCRLTSISPSTFRGAESTLKYLDLASNDISTITPFTFQEFSTLETLLLNINNLQNTLTINTFRGLENSLQTLNLEGTNMDTNHLVAVSYLKSLQTLKLSSNIISSLPDFIFSQLNQLKVLEFNTNSLSTVRPAAMFGLQNSLEAINLKTNQIATISHCTFRDFTALETIFLSNNALWCDCHGRWLREWLDKYNQFELKQFEWICAGPAPHANRLIYDIDADDMVCDDGEGVEECQTYTSPTVPSLPDIPTTTTPTGLYVNTTMITEREVTLVWHIVGAATVTNFLVVAVEIDPQEENAEPVFQEGVDAGERNITVNGLFPGTTYTICLTAFYLLPDEESRIECVNATTTGSALPVSNKPSELAIILGSILGVLAFVILLVIVIIVVRRSTASTAAHPYNKNGGLPESRADLPTMGYNSKRFSKPRSTMTSLASSRDDLESKLDGFTQDERNRILQLLSSSTLSMASAGSTRYLDEPRPHQWTGGASAYYNEESPYHEIPPGDQYEYIPADQVSKYDYIPADQVQRPDPNAQPSGENPPPLPPLHPESSEAPTLVISDGLSQPIPHPTQQHESAEWI